LGQFQPTNRYGFVDRYPASAVAMDQAENPQPWFLRAICVGGHRLGAIGRRISGVCQPDCSSARHLPHQTTPHAVRFCSRHQRLCGGFIVIGMVRPAEWGYRSLGNGCDGSADGVVAECAKNGLTSRGYFGSFDHREPLKLTQVIHDAKLISFR
jgi:hypothetical protein